ncbi:MAG TPA: M20/M25/M40 family metallo-hydrolase [Thermoanaerobaculia bacterium]|nr:M20/M25/M40 family metallo-hydrolase [Thermoanaerobaculia bacterium]
MLAVFALALLLSPADDVTPLLAKVRASNAMVDDLRELCDSVGGRPTGSPAGTRAEEWAARKFRDAGVPVTLESYTLPATWRSRLAAAEAVAPAAFPLRIAAAPFSASTNGTIEGTLVDFGDGAPEVLAKVPESKGTIALVRTGIMGSLDDLFGDYMRIKALLETAKRTGVAAMLLESSQRRSLLYRHPMSLDGSIVPLPVAVVAHDHAERLLRLMSRGDVRVSLRLDNEIGGKFTARNVVAEIRGSDKADEIVVIGAHLDSWDMGTGALDNGVNAVSVLDLARQIKALGMKPRRTIRFIDFTGEENGMIGSRAYAEAHRAEMPKHAAMITMDIGSGKTTGFFLNGREELRPMVEKALAPLLEAKAQQNAVDALDGTDNFDFILFGVPNLVANQDPVPYLPEYHAESDTFDKVDVAAAKENEAIDAALLWYLANADERLPQQTRADVEKLLSDQHLVEQMKQFAQWEDWAAHRRGLR